MKNAIQTEYIHEIHYYDAQGKLKSVLRNMMDVDAIFANILGITTKNGLVHIEKVGNVIEISELLDNLTQEMIDDGK